MVLTSIIRPLPPDAVLVGKVQARELLIGCAANDVAVVERYVQRFGIHQYSSFVTCGVYNAIITMVPHLKDERARGIFTRAAYILSLIARDVPMTRYVLQGIRALAWAMQMSVPVEAVPYFDGPGAEKSTIVDLPISIALPETREAREMLGSSERNGGKGGLEMGMLISKWSKMSLE